MSIPLVTRERIFTDQFIDIVFVTERPPSHAVPWPQNRATRDPSDTRLVRANKFAWSGQLCESPL